MLGEVAGRFRVDGGTCSDPTLQNLSDTKVTPDTPIDPEKSRRRPDFYVVNERLRFAVIVENKIRHHESRDQLKDYWEAMREDKPGFKIGGIFLAPERRKPKQAGDYPYVSLSYGDIADLLVKALKDTTTNSEHDALPKQYADAIRRWFVLDPKQQRLAWQILQGYPKAVELLRDKKSQPMQQLVDELSELIRGQLVLECLNSDPTVKDLEYGELGFVLKEWNEIDSLRTGADEEKSVYGKRLITFWFSEPERDLAIYISVATPTHAKDKTAQRAIVRAVSHSGFRRTDFGEPNPNWIDFLVRRLASKEELKNPDRDVVFEQIQKAWELFVDKDLRKIKESIQGIPAFRQSSRRSSRAA